jgi:hypothetical protein
MIRARLLILSVLAFSACSSDVTDGTPLPATTLEVISGSGQSQLAGYPLPEPIVFRAIDDMGRPVPDLVVNISATAVTGEVTPTAATTGIDGTVSVSWRLAAAVGAQQLDVYLEAPGGPYHSTASATATGSAVKAISGSAKGACAVYLDGRLGCFKVRRDPPLQTPVVQMVNTSRRFTDVAIVEANSNGTFGGCAVETDGRVWCFDLESQGASTTNWREVPGEYAPIQSLRGGGTGVSPYRGAFCGLDLNGAAWCWGDNTNGILGAGDLPHSVEARRIAIAPAVSGLTVGGDHACARETDGTAWCWGRNTNGQLGRAEGNGLHQPAPVATSLRFGKLLAGGFGGTCGLVAAETYCWGSAIPAELLPNTEADEMHLPQPVAGASIGFGRTAAWFFVLQGGGTATVWGHIPQLHALESQWVRQPARYPIPFNEVLQNVPNNMFCGRQGTLEPVACYIPEMFTLSPAHVVDPQRVVGFGVPFAQ